MTSYASDALIKFHEQAEQIVQSFLAENRKAFLEYAQEKAIAIHGERRGQAPPQSVVANFAEIKYRSLVVKERE